MSELSSSIAGFLKRRKPLPEPVHAGEHITINDAVGAVAFYYEKIRNIVEFTDEHLLRQNAIRRILNRRLIFGQSSYNIALALLKELVRSRYFHNSTVPESKVHEIERILLRYEGIAQALRKRKILSDRDQDWLYSMASCAIDEALVAMQEEEALVQMMYETVGPQIQLEELEASAQKLQTYLATYRILMKPNIYRLRYFVLKSRYPAWHHRNEADPEVLAMQFREVESTVEALINHPVNKKLSLSLARFRIPFIVLHTIVRNNEEGILSNEAQLEKEVRRICEGFYAVQRRRLTLRTTRAFIYLFLTKMALGLAIEIPYDLIVEGAFHAVPVVINVAFPPVLLAVIALSAPLPKKSNTDLIVQAVREIVYSDTPRSVFVPQLQKVQPRSVALNAVFFLLYAAMFGLTFSLLYVGLSALGFNVVSGVVFFIFFSLVTFFAVTLRRSVRELMITRPKANLLTYAVDLLILPIMKVGHWLSFNISKVNIFIFIFDVLIEVPLQALFEITEEWFAFIKEKKDELE